mmetsp:Transcript_19727/g.49574  ORF Transcript_19727/g.49574 Transcript_19727/m.49574 type:complete len:432 (-) Transcript_19727:305-1600(-)|eukprot:CAMPEP_0178993254 /NCGR_PEP_ID=MMETSP0795-20121207/6602_1 /TAXON_ID=88552 /ORGANISM="Amoebophrya sp., Strain Ameob2" /LENGTH=431 /DNA_ID=CAMNT_0020685295 /DNA_START=102 /DNA_END=1397 /DNA_ORIENTATION=+
MAVKKRMEDPAEVRRREAQVLAAAKRIGIEINTERHMMWIAEFASQAELPPEWREFQTEDGETAYYHPGTKCLSKTHPVLDKFETFIEQQRDFAKNHDPVIATMSTEQLAAKLGVVLDGVLNRYNKGLPPVTPEIVESVALYFCVPTEKEYGLALQIRMALEAYVDTQYTLTLVTRDLVDPMGFLKNMRKDIIARCVLQKEDPVLMCQECEERSAKLKCEQCKDFFCMDCFQLTHATGKRKSHKTQNVEQIVCDLCDKVHAVTVSLESHQRFCDNCYQKKRRDMVGHRMRVIKGLPCSECAANFDAQDINDTGESNNDDPDDDARFGNRQVKRKNAASVLCEDCSDLFCYECFVELHRKGKRLHHVSLSINDEGQLIRQGDVLPPEEGQAHLDRARLTAEGGYYVPFRDDQFNTYWYHFRDKIITHQNPYM